MEIRLLGARRQMILIVAYAYWEAGRGAWLNTLCTWGTFVVPGKLSVIAGLPSNNAPRGGAIRCPAGAQAGETTACSDRS